MFSITNSTQVSSRRNLKKWIVLAVLLFTQWAQPLWAAERSVRIIQPQNNAKVANPVKVCMELNGLVLQRAKEGVQEGKGHHHILMNSLPIDLSQPIQKGEIHMGDASRCRELTLKPGLNIIYAVFAYGNHVPYDPPITDKIIITVLEE